MRVFLSISLWSVRFVPIGNRQSFADGLYMESLRLSIQKITPGGGSRGEGDVG
jgi:hypothetical protein